MHSTLKDETHFKTAEGNPGLACLPRFLSRLITEPYMSIREMINQQPTSVYTVFF